MTRVFDIQEQCPSCLRFVPRSVWAEHQHRHESRNMVTGCDTFRPGGYEDLNLCLTCGEQRGRHLASAVLHNATGHFTGQLTLTEFCWHRTLTDGMLARALAHADITPPLKDIALAGTELRREMGFKE